MPLVKLYPMLSPACSTIELVLFIPEIVVYAPKMPRWVEPMPSILCVNSRVFTSHTRLVFGQVIQHYNFFEKEKWMKGYALEKWESTLNPVFMPMDTMYTLSWKLLLK